MPRTNTTKTGIYREYIVVGKDGHFICRYVKENTAIQFCDHYNKLADKYPDQYPDAPFAVMTK
jgi:hypothetical protein